MKLEYNTDWQTQARGDNDSEYQIYLACANDGNGLDFTTGKPLKTYDEWLQISVKKSLYRRLLGVSACQEANQSLLALGLCWEWNLFPICYKRLV